MIAVATPTIITTLGDLIVNQFHEFFHCDHRVLTPNRSAVIKATSITAFIAATAQSPRSIEIVVIDVV